MKLKDLLKTIDENDTVAIGAQTCYLYFGSPANLKEIKDISKDIFTESGYSLRNFQEMLKNLPERKMALEKKLKEAFKECKDDILNDSKKDRYDSLEQEVTRIVRSLAECEHKKHYYRSKILELSLYRRNYVHLLDREVIRHYRQDAADYAYAIIIEGDELGKYWTKSEYDSGYVDDDLD